VKTILANSISTEFINSQEGYVDESVERGPRLTYLNSGKLAAHFQYCSPNLEEYQNEKHLEVIANEYSSNLPQINSYLAAEILTESPCEQLRRSWQHFFKPRLERIISQRNFEIPALFPGPTVRAANKDKGDLGKHQRGTLFYEQYIDMLGFEGGLPSILSGEKNAIRTNPLKCLESNWAWMYIDEPQLLSIVPSATFDNLPSAHIDKYLRCTAESLLSYLSANDLSVERVLNLVHKSWTTDNAHYSKIALQAAEQIIESVKAQITLDVILPFMFELEAMTSVLSCLSKLEVIASGTFDGNWIDIAALPVLSCRGSELCNEDRLFQELLKLPKHRFAPLLVSESGNVCDGNHRLTAVWIWNLLKTCIDCNWDLVDLQFQQNVAAYLSTQEMKQRAVSVHQALNHLGAFLQDSYKRELLQKQLVPNIRRFNKIETLPVVMLPEYLSSAVIKDLYDDKGVRIRVQPHICELMMDQNNTVLPARGTYHFADCVPLPWFRVV
jgi:hypothetical protein